MVSVAVIIPAHNEERVIGTTLQRIVQQTDPPDEIIVVDDGSTDGTKRIVETFIQKYSHIKLLSYPQGHSAAFARNRGAEHAKSDVLVFIDADIEVHDEDFIRKVRETFSDPTVSAAYFSSPEVKKRKNLLQAAYLVRAQIKHFYDRLFGLYHPYPSVIRRDVFLKAGGFNERIFYYEDEELYQKLRTHRIVAISTIHSHEDPSDMGELARQSRWVGKGAVTYGMIFKKPQYFFYPLYPPFWILFFLTGVGSIFVPFLWPIFSILLLVLLLQVPLGVFLHRSIVPVLFYVFVLSPLRSYHIVISFISHVFSFGKKR